MSNFKSLKKTSKTAIVLSLLYSFFILFGFSFWLTNSWNLIFGSSLNMLVSLLIFILLFFLVYFIIVFLFKKLNKYSLSEVRELKPKNRFFKKFMELHVKYPFRFSLAIILLAWLPYIIAFYPIVLNPDGSYQIKQYFGITTQYNLFSDLIDKDVIITNHHPIIHTLLLGTSLKIGNVLGNDNFGLFIYSVIQILILSSSLSYSIKYLKSIGVGEKYRFIVLLIYSLLPIFPFYAMTGVKDVIFSALILLYIILLHKIITSKERFKKKDIFFALLLMIFVVLFRNNGFHVILLSFPWLFIIKKIQRKQLIVIFSVIVGFSLFYNNILLPYFKITPSSIRESLSIPFQQTARYVKYYKDEVTSKERSIINSILDYDILSSNYKPEISDPIKNTFNRFYKDEDLKKYFGVWFNQFLKHPGVYFEATMNNTYGYFFPLKFNWYIYHNYNPALTDDGFDYSFNGLYGLRFLLYQPTKVIPFIPVIGWLVNIGFNVWLVIFMSGYLIYRRKYRYIIFLAPAIILILVCIASPVNAYYRYALPFIFSMPLMIGLFMRSIKVHNIDKKIEDNI